VVTRWCQLAVLLDPESQYYVLRKDRNIIDTRGGGVCAFVSRKLHIIDVDIDERFNSLEILSFDLLCHESKIRFFITYRPPYRDIAAVRYLQLLLECLCKLFMQIAIKPM